MLIVSHNPPLPMVRLADAGFGAITTEIGPFSRFFYAEDYHQQYLHKVQTVIAASKAQASPVLPSSPSCRHYRRKHRSQPLYPPCRHTWSYAAFQDLLELTFEGGSDIVFSASAGLSEMTCCAYSSAFSLCSAAASAVAAQAAVNAPGGLLD